MEEEIALQRFSPALAPGSLVRLQAAHALRPVELFRRLQLARPAVGWLQPYVTQRTEFAGKIPQDDGSFVVARSLRLHSCQPTGETNMKNQITAAAIVLGLLSAVVAVPLLFRQAMDLLFVQPGGWQVWLLLGSAVFVIEQVSAWMGAAPRRRAALAKPVVRRA